MVKKLTTKQTETLLFDDMVFEVKLKLTLSHYQKLKIVGHPIKGNYEVVLFHSKNEASIIFSYIDRFISELKNTGKFGDIKVEIFFLSKTVSNLNQRLKEKFETDIDNFTQPNGSVEYECWLD